MQVDGLVSLASSRRAFEDIVDTQDHLGRFCGADDHLAFELVRLAHALLLHVRQLARIQIESGVLVTVLVGSTQLGDELGRVQTSVIRQNGRQLSERLGKCFCRNRLFARRGSRRVIHHLGHAHLGTSATEQHPRLAHRLREDGEGVVQRSLCFVEHLRRGTAQHHRARFAGGNARELDQLVLANHDLLDASALADLDQIRSVKGTGDLAARDEGQTLDTLEVGVLDRHDARVGKQALRVVVDELAVDKARDAVRLDLVHLGLHLFALGTLELGELAGALDAHACAKHLDLVRVHGRVGDEDLGVVERFGTVGADLLVEDEALVEVRVGELAAGLLDDLDVLEVGGSLEAEDGVDGEVGKVVLVCTEHLAGERGACDVHEVLAECGWVGTVVLGGIFESLECGCGCDAVSFDDRLRVDAHVDQLFCFAQQFGRQHTHAGGAIAHLVVLHLGDVDQDLGGGIVEVNGLEDGGAVVGDYDVVRADALQDLVHALGSERGLDQVAERDGADERAQASVLRTLLRGLLRENRRRHDVGSRSCLVSKSVAPARRRVGEAALHSASAKLRLSCSAASDSSQQRVGAAQSRAKRREGRRTKKRRCARSMTLLDPANAALLGHATRPLHAPTLSPSHPRSTVCCSCDNVRLRLERTRRIDEAIKKRQSRDCMLHM
ncbi:hypothetical protein L1887_43971 [Cichorium endivia]|nr:hypothetical protein L1887_43971 [Cichorium endivia]